MFLTDYMSDTVCFPKSEVQKKRWLKLYFTVASCNQLAIFLMHHIQMNGKINTSEI